MSAGNEFIGTMFTAYILATVIVFVLVLVIAGVIILVALGIGLIIAIPEVKQFAYVIFYVVFKVLFSPAIVEFLCKQIGSLIAAVLVPFLFATAIRLIFVTRNGSLFRFVSVFVIFDFINFAIAIVNAAVKSIVKGILLKAVKEAVQFCRIDLPSSYAHGSFMAVVKVDVHHGHPVLRVFARKCAEIIELGAPIISKEQNKLQNEVQNDMQQELQHSPRG